MRLLIISHTEHYKTSDGTIVGWGPTVNEINHLLDVFSEIYHIGMLKKELPPPSALPYASDKITFVPIPAVGGKSFIEKLKIIYEAPKTLHIVKKYLRKTDIFQLRTPTGIGVFLIPYLTFFTKRKGWYKYAGNWNQKNPPLGYAVQRWMLKNQKRKVTINGSWPNQPEHCLTFENPCLTEADIEEGVRIRTLKTNKEKLIFCFVGRLETEKGVGRIINALTALTKEDKQQIEIVHFIGDGRERAYFESLGNSSGVNLKFHGFLSRKDVFEIYKQSHFFLLPSTASEGFPKVLGEALNFGCVPITSGISSITDYIKHDKNGFIINPMTTKNLKSQIIRILWMDDSAYHDLIRSGESMSRKFSYSYYNMRIKDLFLSAKTTS